MRAVALADDTTGALEIGALFAKQGVVSRVSLGPALPSGAQAAVVDLETRHLPPSDAYAAVQGFCRTLHGPPRVGREPRLYKKTDSALRGNIGAEMQALLDAFPGVALVYVPAYPALGRSVRGGKLRIGGLPVSRTPFAGDALNPSIHDDIPVALAAGGCRASVVLAATPSRIPAAISPGSIVVCDGESEADLDAIAEALATAETAWIPAGPGAFAARWIGGLKLPVSAVAWPRPRTLLVVNGSTHPVSLEQIRAAPDDVAVITAPLAREPSPPEVARRLAREVKQRLQAAGPGGPIRTPDCLVIVGGDTAWHVLQALGASVIEPRGELLPGVPVSVISMEGRELTVVTKAGSFGSPEVLSRIRERLLGGNPS
jgi:uncharacterized protein YgbK (DUF1537 family)